MAPAPRPRSNALLALGLAGVIGGMLGLSFAAVPLYRIFCQITGYGGTPRIDAAASPGAVERTITIRFNADLHNGMPWRFAPAQREVTLRIGEEAVAFYTARNPTDRPVTGVSTYNVTPDKAGRYFHKTACFCFDEQTLTPGQEMSFPLSFWIDPAILADPGTRDLRTVTLSYTFFRSLEDASLASAASPAGPHAGRRQATP
jgi:cytochrome c oxidase assembly protein subunit 11